MAAKNLHELAYAVAYVTFSIGILSTLLRFYSRALVVKSWGWDDYGSVAVLVSYFFPPFDQITYLNTAHSRLSTSPIKSYSSYFSVWAAGSKLGGFEFCLMTLIGRLP